MGGDAWNGGGKRVVEATFTSLRGDSSLMNGGWVGEWGRFRFNLGWLMGRSLSLSLCSCVR